MKIQRKKSSILVYSWGIISAIAFALNPTIGKLALLDYSPQTLAILKATIAAFIIFMGLLTTKKLNTLKVKTKDIPIMLLSGIFYSVVVLGFWIALNTMKITDLMALFWVYPLINLIIEMIQYKKIHLKGVFYLLVGLVGVYIASGGLLVQLLALEPSLLWIGLSSLFFAFFFKMNEDSVTKEYPMFTRIFWNFLISAVVIILLYRNFTLATLATITPIGWGIFGLMALIPCIAAYYFTFRSIKLVGSVATGALDFLEPAIAVIFAMLFWGEALTILQVAGWGLILISLLNIPKMNNKKI